MIETNMFDNVKFDDASKMIDHLENFYKYKVKIQLISSLLSKGAEKFCSQKMKNEALAQDEIDILNKHFDELKEIHKVITAL